LAENTASIWGANIYSRGSGTINLSNSVLDDSTGIKNLAKSGSFYDQLPMLGPLTDNGGPTPTRLPLPGSPLRDMGSNPSNQSFDQRGGPRLAGAAVDIGSIESVDATPIVRVTAADVLTSGATSNTFTIQFSSASLMNVDSIINNNA